MRILILEDDRNRRIAMLQRLNDRFPNFVVEFFDAANSMIECLESAGLQDVVLLSLDHDLELLESEETQWVDPGTGVEVAEWLVRRPATCPIIIHTTNQSGGDKMQGLLEDADWKTDRIIPYGDLAWIDERWFPTVRNAIVHSAPRSEGQYSRRPAAGIQVLRTVLQASTNAQSFCGSAFGKLLAAYRDELSILADDERLSIELFFLSADNLWHPAEVGSGPISSTFVGPAGIAHEVVNAAAGRGRLLVDDLRDELGIVRALQAKGVGAIQFEIVEISAPQKMQAVIAVAFSTANRDPVLQPIIRELIQSVEVAVLIGVIWGAGQGRPNHAELTDSGEDP